MKWDEVIKVTQDLPLVARHRKAMGEHPLPLLVLIVTIMKAKDQLQAIHREARDSFLSHLPMSALSSSSLRWYISQMTYSR